MQPSYNYDIYIFALRIVLNIVYMYSQSVASVFMTE